MSLPTPEEVEEFIIHLGKLGHGQSVVLLRQFASLLRGDGGTPICDTAKFTAKAEAPIEAVPYDIACTLERLAHGIRREIRPTRTEIVSVLKEFDCVIANGEIKAAQIANDMATAICALHGAERRDEVKHED